MSKTDQAAIQPATRSELWPTAEEAVVAAAEMAALRAAMLAPESNPEDATLDQIREAILAPEKATTEPPAGTPLTALETLRVNGREPLTIWKTRGPKSVGGEIAAVLCQDDNTIVLVHTLPSGKWSVFKKVVIS